MDINRRYFSFFDATFAKGDACICQGGRRAGKTYAILQYIILQLYNARGKALIVTDTFARLRDTLLTDIISILGVTGRNDAFHVITHGSPHVRFPNGSLISFVCADRDTRGYSSDRDFLFFNEAIMYDYSIYRNALLSGGDNCKVFIDYNPYTRFWVQTEAIDEGWNKLITSYRDNPKCPQSARKQLEKQASDGANAEPGTLARYLYDVECCGIDSSLSGLCFPNVEACQISDYTQCAEREILAADWGQVTGGDPDVIVGMKIDDERKRIYVREIYYSNEGSDADIAEVLKAISFTRQPFIFETATGGANRVANIHSLNGLRYHFMPAVKGKGSVMVGIRNLQEYKLLITVDSINILMEQQNYKYVLDGDILKPVDKWNHAFDALRYGFDAWVKNKHKAIFN